MGYERTFRIKCDETYTTRKTTWYEVEAESFDEAKEKLYDGYGDWQDEDSWDEDREDQSIEEIECGECCGEEGYCECDRSDDDDDYKVSADDNPDHNTPGTLTVHELEVGKVYVPADGYTIDRIGGDRVLEFEELDRGYTDDDGDYRARYKDDEYGSSRIYVNDACRFRAMDAGDVEERLAAQEAARAALELKRSEIRAVEELLDI
jgi:hypothetical protein